MIKFDKVNKIYNQGKENSFEALKNINMDIDGSGLILITGKSGCGKTTMLNLIGNLDSPTTGQITRSDNLKCSFVFQDFQLIDYLTIKENLILACNISRSNDEQINKLAEKYDLIDVLNHYPNQISGGQKQRVAIIRTILLDCPILLCDEPTGNLDEDNSLLIAKLLKKESLQRTVIVVSHDSELFEPFADRIITMKKGSIVSDTAINKNNLILGKEYKIHFSLKEKWFIMSRFIRKNKLKHTFLFISLLLSFILLFSAFNGLFNFKGHVINNVYDDSVSNVVDLSLYRSYDYSAIGTKDLNKYLEDYDVDSVFYDFGIKQDFGDADIARVYMADKTNRKLLYGTNVINDDEVIISDYIARQFDKDISSVVGRIVSGYKIVGIYNTGYLKKDNSKNVDYLERLYETAYFNKVGLHKFITNNYYSFNAHYYYSGSSSASIHLEHCSSETSLAYGEYSDLKKGEIGISKEVAGLIKDDMASLIGEKISITFVNYADFTYQGTEEITKEYTIKYITSKSIGKYMYTSNEDFMDILYDSNDRLHHYITNGISLVNPSARTVSKLVDKDLDDNGFLAEDLNAGLDWLKPLRYIELAIGLIMLIVSIILISNFVHMIFEKEKRVQGVLASFGVSKNGIVSMYLGEIFMLISLIFMACCFLQFGSVGLINYIITSQKITSLNIVYYSIFSVISILGIILLLMILTYFFISKRIKSKEIIDIIYER